MALTRKMLKAMGIEDEKIDQIIEAHSETVDALKEQRDGFKAQAEKAEGLEKELEDLKSAPGDGFREKYEKEHADFEAYKGQVSEEKAHAEKEKLYRKLLTDSGIDPKRIDAVLRVTDLSGVTVKDGQIQDAEKLTDGIKSEWSDFILKSGTQAATVDTPPANNGGKEGPRTLAEALRERYQSKE